MYGVKKHRLNRADMEQIIRDGGSVMMPTGHIITELNKLPDAADLALHIADPRAVQEAKAKLLAERDIIDERIHLLDNPPARPDPAAPSPLFGPQGQMQEQYPGEFANDPREAERQALFGANPTVQAGQVMPHQPTPEGRPLAPPQYGPQAQQVRVGTQPMPAGQPAAPPRPAPAAQPAPQPAPAPVQPDKPSGKSGK